MIITIYSVIINKDYKKTPKSLNYIIDNHYHIIIYKDCIL